MAILLYLQIITVMILGIYAAAVPQQPIILSSPCGILPLSNTSDFSGVQTGGASLWGHETVGGPTKWTDLYVKGLTVIPYCFPTEDHRKANADKLSASTYDLHVKFAIDKWMNALGGAASQSAGHYIMFHEWVDSEKKPRYCIDVDSPVESKWNLKIPYKTVAIWRDNDIGERAGSATMGMGQSPGKPWELDMWLADDIEVASITHEFGHVMGMGHEHQRSERNTYVRYDCTKLLDYHDAIARAREDDPSLTSTEFCTDLSIANKYSFSGRSYMQVMELDGKTGYTLDAETPYDANSIMHYHSYIMGNDKCQRGDQAQCPLGIYRDPNVHEQGFEIIPLWFKPSSWDVAWVKMFYGWTGVSSGGSGADTNVMGDDLDELLEKARVEYVKNQV